MFRKSTGRIAAACALAVALATAMPLHAQVPADLAAQNRALGPRIDVPSAIATYKDLEQPEPYPASDVHLTRDVAYGPEARHRLDVFAPGKAAARKLPVVIYATGGDFTRRIDLPGGAPFYDNVLLWAAKHGYVGVNTDRRHFKGNDWELGPEDMRAMIGWVQQHIGEYGGDPARVVFLGHAFGGTQLVSYIAHPEYWCCNGRPGIAAAVIVSAPLNLQPATLPPAAPPPAAPGAAPRPPNPLFDAAHSDLEGLRHMTMPVYIGSAQLEAANQKESAEVLHKLLCGAKRCPETREFIDHNHLSVMFSFNTGDESVSGPIDAWMKKVTAGAGKR
jgi:triacylglycerol lipase